MTDIVELTARNQRRLILRLLSKLPDFKAINYDIYTTLVDAHVSISMAQVKTILQWLIEQGFVVRLSDDQMVVRLTDHGLDIVNQNANHPDIHHQCTNLPKG